MKWLVIGVLVCLAGHGQCGALKCTSEAKDPICTEERLNKDPANQISKDETQETAGVQVSEMAECLPGSKWDSKCHKCTCSDKGLAECAKEENCKQEVPGDPIRCKPTTQFKRGCHSCICLQDLSEDVKVLCSLTCADASATSTDKDVLPQGKECAPGTTWKSQCNECGCTQNGEHFCTRKSCLQEEMGIEMRCAPNSRWSYDCNTCWCSDNGVAACTQKGCIEFQLAITEEKDEKSPVVTEIPATKQNTNNPKYISEDTNLVKLESDLEYYDQIFNDGNHEIDDPDDSHEELINLLDRDEDYSDKNLEMNHSFPQVEDVHNVLKRSVCKPNQEFQSECNACKCASDGLSYTCTHNECMEGETNREVEVFMENEGTDHIEKHSVCKPRGTFYIGCNTCHCNYHGTDYSCTNNPCPLPEDVELFHELKATKLAKNDTNKIVCVANRMFIKDCNTCWCNEDGTSYFCTRRVCVSPDDSNDDEEKPEELRVIMKECRPDEVFELGCNMCRCNPDGKSFSCTRRACVEPVDEEQKNSTISRKTRGVTQTGSKNCQPGQEFRMDCNQCLCDNEGQEFSCTRIDCNGQNNNEASASARAKRDAVTSTKVEMKCVPGSVFDKECNVCRCTSDGGHAVCTNKRCSIPASNQEDDKTGAPEVDPNFRCNPGEQFKRGCKDCSCSADGKSIYCTVRYCDQDITPTPSSHHQKK